MFPSTNPRAESKLGSCGPRPKNSTSNEGKPEFRHAEEPEPNGPSGRAAEPTTGISPACWCLSFVTVSTTRDSEPLVPPTVCAGPPARTRSHLSHDGSGRSLRVDLGHLILTQIKNLLVSGVTIRRSVTSRGTQRRCYVPREETYRCPNVGEADSFACETSARPTFATASRRAVRWSVWGRDLSLLEGHNTPERQ